MAVVGRSGAGKSTLVNLLLRFYDPKGGAVLLNGQLLPSYNLRMYRQRVGLVSQDTQLFCRPISENIAYGLSEEVSIEDVKDASRKANADEFIDELQDKYQSMIGEGGQRLSGGQKQRLAIARALLRKPSLLLLDEATSALDAENEGKVQKALDDLMEAMAGQCSIMLIAHRLSTVMNADKIVVLDSGVVAEQGTHEQLLESGGIYAQLVQRQLAKQKNTISEEPAVESAAPEERSAKGNGKGNKGKKEKRNKSGASEKVQAPDSIDGLFSDM